MLSGIHPGIMDIILVTGIPGIRSSGIITMGIIITGITIITDTTIDVTIIGILTGEISITPGDDHILQM